MGGGLEFGEALEDGENGWSAMKNERIVSSVCFRLLRLQLASDGFLVGDEFLLVRTRIIQII